MSHVSQSWTALLSALILALLLQPLVSQAASLPDHNLPDFMGVQLKTSDLATLNAVHDMGFRVVRRGFYWSSFEKTKGEYTFADYEPFMAEAKKLNMTVIAVLFGPNKLYKTGTERAIQTDEGREGFAKFAAAVAAHFKDNNVIWEIWNEPNVRTFWRHDGTHNSPEFAKEYSALVNAVAPAIMKADPHAIVAAGSVSNYWKPSYEWTEYCFQNGVLKSGISAWSVHPYGTKSPEDFAEGHTITRDLLKKYGAPDMPMIDTERGFKLSGEGEGAIEGPAARANEIQAWHFVRQIMIDQLFGLRLTSWYEWAGKEGFSLTGQDTQTPAYDAAANLIKQLNGYHLAKRIDSGYDRDYVLLWQNDAGMKKLVVWTAPPQGDGPDKAYPHKMTIDLGAAGSVSAVDINGKDVTLKVDGQSCEVSLTGAPQYLTVPNNANVVAKSIPPFTAPITAAVAPSGANDLKLFAPGADWKFTKNTGDGSFELSKDGDKNIGVLNYDFTKPLGHGTPYVLASTAVNIEGGSAVLIFVKSDVKQRLTFRLVDSTGQTLQYKGSIQGSNVWEQIRIPLTGRLEHWGGANDAKAHFPIKSIAFSVPLPSDDHKTGKVQYADVSVVGSDAAAADEPAPAQAAAPAKKPVKPAPAAEAAAAAPTVAAPTGPELNLFADGHDWKFVPNTGKGSFELSKDGDTPIGVLNFDFSKPLGHGVPYVIAQTDTNIPEATAVQFMARADHEQRVTVRFKDSTGQTLQFKGKVKGTGSWEAIRIPLTGRLEHWGGANDAKAHFPLSEMALSIPLTGEAKTGKIEFSNATYTDK